jgi:hypothetical protein
MKRHQPSPRRKKFASAPGGRVVEVRSSGDLRRLNEHAAGIDIGAERHYVAVPPGSSEHEVQEFGAFTKDL